jgi:hypothetical protein
MRIRVSKRCRGAIRPAESVASSEKGVAIYCGWSVAPGLEEEEYQTGGRLFPSKEELSQSDAEHSPITFLVTGVIYFLAAVTNRISIMVEGKMSVEGWFLGSRSLSHFGIAIAYTLWDVYRVTTR